MRREIGIGAAVAGGVALGTAAFVGAASAQWSRATRRAVRRLMAELPRRDDLAPAAATFTPEQLDGLPEPVARYFRFALTPGEPLIRHARISWRGEFRSRPRAPWSPFTAVQHFTAVPPGFVWDATIRISPLAPVRVRDSYIAGEGTMIGKVAAVVPVADQRGTPSMAAGALSRYLGEAVWFPTALLPGAGIEWSPIDDRSARATLRDGDTTVSADFHFAASGEITSVSMTRMRDVHGRGVPTPFDARYDAPYRTLFGMRVPTGGEVEWLLPEGRFTYWRGRAVEIEYELAR